MCEPYKIISLKPLSTLSKILFLYKYKSLHIYISTDHHFGRHRRNYLWILMFHACISWKSSHKLSFNALLKFICFYIFRYFPNVDKTVHPKSSGLKQQSTCTCIIIHKSLSQIFVFQKCTLRFTFFNVWHIRDWYFDVCKLLD